MPLNASKPLFFSIKKKFFLASAQDMHELGTAFAQTLLHDQAGNDAAPITKRIGIVSEGPGIGKTTLSCGIHEGLGFIPDPDKLAARYSSGMHIQTENAGLVRHFDIYGGGIDIDNYYKRDETEFGVDIIEHAQLETRPIFDTVFLLRRSWREGRTATLFTSFQETNTAGYTAFSDSTQHLRAGPLSYISDTLDWLS